MGYILPISNFEYMDYQKRVIQNERDHHYIEKPYQIKLDMQKQFMYDHNNANEIIPESKHIPFEEIKLINPKRDQLIAQITGKGALFNKII